MATQSTASDFTSNLGRVYGIYTGGFLAFVVLLAILEQVGVPDRIIGYLFVFFTLAIYAGIGILSRTMQVSEYYVAGRRVPAFYNGMATGADWMSAASFIGMAGTLYALGYDGLAYILGWTGGYVLVAVLVAPYLRKFGAYTVPDFLAARYGGNFARLLGIIVLLSCSFTYVVAQIVGTGPDRQPVPRHGLHGRRLCRPARHPGLLHAGWHARRSPGRRWLNISS
jgi:cation/acetate symporter